MTMNATILTTEDDRLLVQDHATGEEVVVHTPCACKFRAGERIRIAFNGIMTRSLPPQITAESISRLRCC